MNCNAPFGNPWAKSTSAFGMLVPPAPAVLFVPLNEIWPLKARSYNRFSCVYATLPPTLKECRAVVCARLSTHWKVLIAVRLGWSIPPPRLVTDALPDTKPPENVICGMFPRPIGAFAGIPVLKPNWAAVGPGCVAKAMFDLVQSEASFVQCLRCEHPRIGDRD